MRRKLTIQVEFLRHRWPVFAFGFISGGSEFVLALWLIEIRVGLGY